MADGKVIIDIDGNSSGFRTELDGIESIALSTASALKSAMIGIGGEVASAAKAAVSVGTEYTAAMSEVKAISGATEEEYTRLAEKAREMGATTIFSASDAADALKYMAMAGWDTESMLAGIDGVLNLAASSGENLGTVSDIVTDAMTAFGMEASEAGHFADVLAAASSAANTNVSMMGETFKYVAPVAGALGYSVEDISVAIGLMANSGIKAGQAGTALRAALSRLVKPTDQVEAAMQRLGLGVTDEESGLVLYNAALTDAEGNMLPLSETIEVLREAFSGLTEAEQASEAATLFGQEAMSGMLAIINASDDDYKTLTKRINEAAGAAESMAEIMTDNLEGDLAELSSAWEEAQLTFFEDANNPLRKVTQWLTEGINEATEAYKNGGIKAMLQEVFDTASEGAVSIKGVALDVLGWVKGKIDEAGGVGGILQEGFDVASEGAVSIKGVALNVYDWLCEQLSKVNWEDVGNKFLDFLGKAFDVLGSIALKVYDWLSGELDKVDWDELGEKFAGALKTGIKNAFYKGSSLEVLVEWTKGSFALDDDLAERQNNPSTPLIPSSGDTPATKAEEETAGGMVSYTTPSSPDAPLPQIDPFTGLPADEGYDIGSDYAAGVAKGIEDGTPAVADAAQRMTVGAIRSSKETADIRSPSHVARDEIGLMYARGVGLGISDGMDEVIDASEAKMDEMIARARAIVAQESSRLPHGAWESFGYHDGLGRDAVSDDTELMRELRGLREDFRRGSVVVLDKQKVGRILTKQQESDERLYGM